MSKSGGVFQIDDVTRTMSKGGCAPGVPPIQVQTPPHLAGWLRACFVFLPLLVSSAPVASARPESVKDESDANK